MQLIANFIKLGVPLKESLVFALKRKREGSRSNLLLYTGIEIHTVEGLIDLPDGALERVVLLVAKKRGVTKLLLQHIDFLHSVLVGGVKGLLAYSIAEKYDFILCFARFTLRFASVEYMFAYGCLFQNLQHISNIDRQMYVNSYQTISRRKRKVCKIKHFFHPYRSIPFDQG